MRLLILSLILSGCTISFQNIHTDGQASDVVDENQTATPQTSTNLSVPVI